MGCEDGDENIRDIREIIKNGVVFVQYSDKYFVFNI